MLKDASVGRVMLEGYRCERCGHQWVPRIKDRVPTVCPDCKNPYWNRPRQVRKAKTKSRGTR